MGQKLPSILFFPLAGAVDPEPTSGMLKKRYFLNYIVFSLCIPSSLALCQDSLKMEVQMRCVVLEGSLATTSL